MKYWENGFYFEQNNSNTRTEISDEYYQELLEKQAQGLYIYDDNGYPRVKVYEPTKHEQAISEIDRLKWWFDNYYAQHEQKYRRLHTLNMPTDEGTSAYDALIALYNEGEIKRARIQELEALID